MHIHVYIYSYMYYALTCALLLANLSRVQASILRWCVENITKMRLDTNWRRIVPSCVLPLSSGRDKSQIHNSNLKPMSRPFCSTGRALISLEPTSAKRRPSALLNFLRYKMIDGIGEPDGTHKRHTWRIIQGYVHTHAYGQVFTKISN